MRVMWQGSGRRLARALGGALVLAVSLAPAAMAQQGGVSAQAQPQFPPTATVGAQDVPASLLLENLSEAEFATDSFQATQITLTPSCGTKLGFGVCPAGGEDPGVYAASATGTGRAGTACAGITFAISVLEPATGRLLFTPNAPVVLEDTGTPAARCSIDFTVDVVRAPAKDSDPAQATPGPLQTDQYGTVIVIDVTPGPNLNQTGSGTGTDETTVLQATPQIVTQVSAPAISPGGTFTDTATVTGPAGTPTPTGTVDFFVYGPNDAVCVGPPVLSSLDRPLNAGGTTVSGLFAPALPGTYRVIAVYSGDANHVSVAGACNDANETVNVTETASPPPRRRHRRRHHRRRRRSRSRPTPRHRAARRRSAGRRDVSSCRSTWSSAAARSAAWCSRWTAGRCGR